ncbi:MAG: hypothetical protein KJ623_02975 [Nanoarchaeota archaeon]|nr:hypothetical protein [Nanoarchaeota archaeon]MBU0962397.1 hypothetical protein [Nanoarchaeota archaeon]
MAKNNTTKNIVSGYAFVLASAASLDGLLDENIPNGLNKIYEDPIEADYSALFGHLIRWDKRCKPKYK